MTDNVVNGGFGEGHNLGEGVGEEKAIDRGVEAAIENIFEIEKQQVRVDEIMQKAKDDCAPFNQIIKENKEYAKTQYSIPAKVLNLKIKERRQTRRINDQIESLKDTDRDQFDLFGEKLHALETKEEAPAEDGETETANAE